jgi:hypothetical protein
MPLICVDYMGTNSRMRICRHNEFGNLRKEDVAGYFKVISWHFHENSEEDCRELQDSEPTKVEVKTGSSVC